MLFRSAWPYFKQPLRFCKTGESHAQAFIAQCAIAGFHETVVCPLAGSTGVESNALVGCLHVHQSAGELAPVIHVTGLWRATKPDKAIQNFDDRHSLEAMSSAHGRYHAREIFNHGPKSKHDTASELFGPEVRWPCLYRPARHIAGVVG